MTSNATTAPIDRAGRSADQPFAYSTAAAAATVAAWASAFVAIRYVGADYAPGGLALGRLLLGSTALGLMLAWRRTWVTPTRSEWVLVTACGVTWFAAYNLALNAAELRVDAGTTAMLVNVGPILIAVLAGGFLGEGMPPWLMIGIAVAFVGVIVISVSAQRGAETDLWGVLLCLIAAVTYAVGVVCQKPTLRRLPALQVTWLACTIGAVVCLPFGGSLAGDLRDAQAGATVGLVYLALVPMALAFSTWAYALARMPAGRLGVTTYAVPPITIAISWVFLGETPTGWALVGGAVCLLGVALSRRGSQPVRAQR